MWAWQTGKAQQCLRSESLSWDDLLLHLGTLSCTKPVQWFTCHADFPTLNLWGILSAPHSHPPCFPARWEKKQAACTALMCTFSNSVNMQSNLVQIAVISLSLSKSDQLHKEFHLSQVCYLSYSKWKVIIWHPLKKKLGLFAQGMVKEIFRCDT